MLKNGRVRFGDFEADLASGELWRAGVPIGLQDLPFRLLTALLERPGELVTRDELTARLWGPGTFVDAAAGLNTAVAKLREALGDNAEQPAYIETVPKRGYRFIGHVDETTGAARLKPRAPEAPLAYDDAPLKPRAPESSRERARPAHEASADHRSPGGRGQPSGRRALIWSAVAIAIVAVAAIAAYQLRADRPQVRVAVVLFDNETGRPELAQLAQGLTDATVTALTAERRLAVIGNAAVLRTARPFRDIEAVRDALDADYIVIGQVQSRDDGLLVREHLIRGRDQAHVWVGVAKLTAGEAALQAEVAEQIRVAVTTRALPAP